MAKTKPSYPELREMLEDLPATWYPSLIYALVEASYNKVVWPGPNGCSNSIKRIEDELISPGNKLIDS